MHFRAHTAYFQQMQKDKLELAMQLEADRMANLLIDDASFAKEIQVVMEERRMRTDDSAQSVLYERLMAAAYQTHPYQRPIIGWMSDILNLTREDLRNHYKTYYAPNNAYVVVVGDFATEELLAKIKQGFGKIQRGPAPPKVAFEEPPQKGDEDDRYSCRVHLFHCAHVGGHLKKRGPILHLCWHCCACHRW